MNALKKRSFMTKRKRTENSKYKHETTGDYCTCAAFLAEKMCLRKSEKENLGRLRFKFWSHKPWDWTFKKQLWTANSLIKTYGEEPLSDLTMDFHYGWENDISLGIHQLKNFLVLQEVLKSKGIKYMFTSMMRQDINVKHLAPRDSELSDNLMLYLDQDNIVESIELITEPYNKNTHYDDCGHPNKWGHIVVAEYFKAELEKRNWLK